MKHLQTATSIRRHFRKVAPGELVTTRDLLIYGNRAAVDQTTYRMVRRNQIERVARGVFRTRIKNTPPPLVHDIALAKAKAFGRRIFVDGSKALQQLFKQTAEEFPRIYATDGSSTSFDSVVGRVHFKQCAPRKLAHADKPVGLVIRGLWDKGAHKLKDQLRWDIMGRIGRIERNALRRAVSLMPAWMTEFLILYDSNSVAIARV